MTSSWLDDAEASIETEKAQQEAVQDAETWNPKAGDLIKGTLMDVKYINTKFGWTHLAIVVDKDSQAWEVWCGRTMLKNALIEQVPALGKGIAIKYEGMKEGKEFKYHSYIVSSEPQDADELKMSHLFYHQLVTSAESGERPDDDRPASHNGSAEDGKLDAPF